VIAGEHLSEAPDEPSRTSLFEKITGKAKIFGTSCQLIKAAFRKAS
jgi:hypothetical protein